MNEISWPHIIGILALILLCILRYTERISEANFIMMFLPVLGALGGIVLYTYGYMKGRSSK